jgi:hypothetical protein
MNIRSPANRGVKLCGAVAVAGVLGLAACASTPPAPTAALQAAEQAIAGAERTDASRHAAGELNQARSKLAAANAQVADKKMVRAGQLAEESRAEAELASARTGAAKAKATNDEMKRSTGTLMEEMRRNEGDTP